jgi:hypothetical protein
MTPAEEIEALRQALRRAEACLKEIEREVKYACWSNPGHGGCPCSSTALRARMSYLWIKAYRDPESLKGTGHQWLGDRLREGSKLWIAYEAEPDP